ncbi:hypothetical protein CEXT_747411 [Caerostris extrusa]|uniref:Uncharacterized protein n=1 Tax=Caerostris extrusa TaxID=172846 RepID=A0AAV4S429_CAEEX|nr:hypothetical protein CEXT_747411 [Caerostris extrusa]
MDVDFTIPMDSCHPLPISVRGTNEDLGGRFWRSMPQDVLIHQWKSFSSMLWRYGLIRVHSFAMSFSAAVLLMIWLWNRNEGREENGKKFTDFICWDVFFGIQVDKYEKDDSVFG